MKPTFSHLPFHDLRRWLVLSAAFTLPALAAGQAVEAVSGIETKKPFLENPTTPPPALPPPDSAPAVIPAQPAAPPPAAANTPKPEQQPRLNAAGLSLYRALVQAGKDLPADGNVVISPASIEPVLHALRLGAAGATAAELDRVLEPSSGQAAPPAQALKPDPALSQANALWIHQKWPVRPEFTNALKQQLSLVAEEAAFAENPAAETQRINDWVKAQTAGQIAQLFSPTDLTADTRLVLVSALAYDGSWDSPFQEKFTLPGKFSTRQGGKPRSIQTLFMHQVGDFPYHETADGIRVLSMPLQQGRQRCVLLLPPAGKDPLLQLANLEKGLTPDRYTALTQELAEKKVDVKLPRLELRNLTSLKNALQALGAKRLFTASKADFTPISTEPGLCVSVLKHETKLELDELGARGSAATGAAMMTRGWPDKPAPMVFDRPFAFAIEDTASGRILFLGRLVTPAAAQAPEAKPQ